MLSHRREPIMEVTPTRIRDVLRIVPKRFGDARGYFSETWSAQRYGEIGITTDFVQDNQSYSADTGTVRGLHYQRPPHAQGKLVRVLQGRIRDVAVDVRRGSPTFGEWVAEELSAETGAQLWIPRGFLHGFVTLEPDTVVFYKVDGQYAPDCDGAVRFDDPDLGSDWQIDTQRAVLSTKDAAAPDFKNFETPFIHGPAS
jgi:dTDP-4-dehydrorhamnose 3,5-epimerase